MAISEKCRFNLFAQEKPSGAGPLHWHPLLVPEQLTDLGEVCECLHLKLESGGLLITDVVPDSPAASAGLQANDVLIRCNDRPITTLEQINQFIQEIKSNPAKLSLIRAGEPLDVEVTPRQEPTNDAATRFQELAFSGRANFSINQFELDRFSFLDRESLPLLVQRLGIEPESYQVELGPYQAELDAMQKALDELKVRISQANAKTKEKQADGTDHRNQQSDGGGIANRKSSQGLATLAGAKGNNCTRTQHQVSNSQPLRKSIVAGLNLTLQLDDQIVS